MSCLRVGEAELARRNFCRRAQHSPVAQAHLETAVGQLCRMQKGCGGECQMIHHFQGCVIWGCKRRVAAGRDGPSSQLLAGAAELVWQELLDRLTYFSREYLNSLAIEVHIVAVVFGMAFHRRIQIDYWNFLGSDDFCRNRIAGSDPLV